MRSNASFTALGVSMVFGILGMSGRSNRDYEVTDLSAPYPLLAPSLVIANHCEIASLDSNSAPEPAKVEKGKLTLAIDPHCSSCQR
jgi:hypothetical protein